MRSTTPWLLNLIGIALAAAPPPLAAAQSRPEEEFADSVVGAASRAINDGRPWQATRLLSNLVRDQTNRPPSVLLAAARAAAQWEGWGSVVRLLDREPWLDRYGDGLGHALLGRALIERSQSEAALPHTRRAVALAPASERGDRLVLHGRALDRANQLDSAAATYLAAAEALPLIRDWLLLRAAGVTTDSGARRALFERVEDPIAEARIPWTEALARDRSGDWRGAARQYAEVGAQLASVRLRLGGDSTARAAARVELAAFLTPDRPPDEIGDAIALFDREFPTRTKTEELRIARRAAAINELDRAARGFAAAGASRLTDRDRFTYATVLARLGRPDQAIPLFDRVRTKELKGDAAYQRARLLVRIGQASRAIQALIAIPTTFPTDSEPAASALFLRADLLVDRQRDDSARAFFLAAATRYPTTPFGQRAALQAALIAFLDRDFAQAVRELDRIAAAPSHAEDVAALYWAARAREAAGDTADARRRYQAVIARGRDGYYAALASRKLEVPFWSFAEASPNVVPDSVPASLVRARRLAALGMRVEARFELDGFTGAVSQSAERITRSARELASGQWHARALRLAQRAQLKGMGLDRDLAQLLYPLPFRDILLGEARSAGLSPTLVAGVIRQESAFDPEARSVADARGLMQVLPSVGAELVRELGVEWDPVLLYQPDLNLDFGIRHLHLVLEKLDRPEQALAAYNAGIDRVGRWRSIRGVEDDAEIFVERIPFLETRDYVRRVLANEAMYAALYRDLAP